MLLDLFPDDLSLLNKRVYEDQQIVTDLDSNITWETGNTRPTSFTRSPDEASILRKKEYDEQQILLDLFPDDLSQSGDSQRKLPKSWTLGPSWTGETPQTSDSALQTGNTGATTFTRSPNETSGLGKKEYDEQQILLDLVPDDFSTISKRESDDQQILVDMGLNIII